MTTRSRELAEILDGLTTEQRKLFAEQIVGWKNIAIFCGYSVSNARRDAGRSYDPLPVRYSHRGVFAYKGAVVAWVERQDFAYAKLLKRNADHKSSFVDRTEEARIRRRVTAAVRTARNSSAQNRAPSAAVKPHKRRKSA